MNELHSSHKIKYLSVLMTIGFGDLHGQAFTRVKTQTLIILNYYFFFQITFLEGTLSKLTFKSSFINNLHNFFFPL